MNDDFPDQNGTFYHSTHIVPVNVMSVQTSRALQHMRRSALEKLSQALGSREQSAGLGASRASSGASVTTS